MRFVLSIFISALIFSCQTEEKSKEKSSEKKIEKKKEIVEVPVMVTTAMQIMTFSSYEDPFYEDTLKMELPITKIKRIDFDSLFTLMYQFSASYPQSKLKEHERFNK